MRVEVRGEQRTHRNDGETLADAVGGRLADRQPGQTSSTEVLSDLGVEKMTSPSAPGTSMKSARPATVPSARCTV